MLKTNEKIREFQLGNVEKVVDHLPRHHRDDIFWGTMERFVLPGMRIENELGFQSQLAKKVDFIVTTPAGTRITIDFPGGTENDLR